MTILATTQPAFALTPDNHDDHGHRGHHDYNRGWNGKDQTVLSATNAARDTHKTSHDVFDKVSTTAHATETATHLNGAAGQLATNVAAGALGVAIQATAAATNLAIEKTAAATNLAIEKTSAAGQLLAVQNAAAAALAAATNHAAILLEMCKCCCKTDELIRSEAGATRALISANEATALRDKLHSSQTAIIIANSKLVGGPIVV